jgi:hypothetical protein
MAKVLRALLSGYGLRHAVASGHVGHTPTSVSQSAALTRVTYPGVIALRGELRRPYLL